MPAKIHYALNRQWELLKLLPAHGAGKSSADLARQLSDLGFQVTKRTVERDLNELLTIFPIECNKISIPYGWRWLPDTGLSLPGISLAEALSLRLVEDFLRPLLPLSLRRSIQPRFNLAAGKMAAYEGNQVKTWPDKVRVIPPGINLNPPQIDQQVLATVQEGLFHDEQLDIEYCSIERKKPSRQIVHPLGLVQRGPVTYLVATAFTYEDIRVYAVHRIMSATRTGEPSQKPKDFSLDQYIQTGGLSFGEGDFIKLKAVVSDYLARILEETPLSEDMKIITRNNRNILSCTIADTGQLLWWIRSLGSEIEVLAPKKVRCLLQEDLQILLQIYSPHSVSDMQR